MTKAFGFLKQNQENLFRKNHIKGDKNGKFL